MSTTPSPSTPPTSAASLDAGAAPVLQASGVSKSFGGLKAVQNFALQLCTGDVQGLIGPNGAGKTTVFNLLTGVYTPDAGAVVLAGRPIAGLRPSIIAQIGMARTFQNIRLFGELSVLDNVKLACHCRTKHTLLGAVLRSPFSVGEERAITRKSMELLELFDLHGRAEEPANSLPYGDQRKLEIARALATDPKVLLLDEPAAGMNPQEKIALRELIRKVRRTFGPAILLIEHDMGVVMDICEKITVLDYGVIIAVGTPEEIQKHPKVIEAYLGASGEEDDAARAEKRGNDSAGAFRPDLSTRDASGGPSPGTARGDA